ncbi:MAG: FAD-binding protein [Candidatus Caenarcaniphilales bacterium]|jgi:glycolate oxidase subunit GlcD|nr:FAD-binding protein [Candidatus Caenarcaniphilales bacterium]
MSVSTTISLAKFLTKLKNLLKDFLSQDQILDQEIDRFLYETDATSLFKNQAAMVLLPNNTNEVAKIIQAINIINLEIKEFKQENIFKPEAKNLSTINFVARGAGTGLSGGAIGKESSVIISLARLNKLISYDAFNRTAVVETGLVNAHLSAHTKSQKLHFSPDPSSQEACTIGGNIAENAGGIHCYKHGLTSDQVLGLEIVTAQGQIEYLGEFHAGFKNSRLDLARFFVGSEGTFGIATKALVKLQPIPESFITMQISFDSIAEATKFISAVIKAAFRPTALELIDSGAIEAVKAAYQLNLAPKTKAIVLLELDGNNSEIVEEAKLIREEILINFQILDLKTTQDQNERKFLWKVRKGTVAAFGQIAPFWYLYDAVVPRSKIPEAMREIEKISDKYKLKLATVAHAADGNLHPNFLYDPDKDPEVIERIHQASHEIMQLCIQLGGVLSGEHGIGLEKKEYMTFMFSSQELELMYSIRKIFDPDVISNPDKIFPIRICKEC